LPESIANIYKEHFTFVTGLASVVGLLAFASSNKIKSTDFESEEIEKFKSLMKTAEDLEKMEKDKSQTSKDIQALEMKKKVMEVSVKKAGLVIFYREQHRKYSEIVLTKIESDKELKSAIEEIKASIAKLNTLQEEIKTDENVEIIDEILLTSKEKIGIYIDDPVLIAMDKIGKKIASFLFPQLRI